MANKFFNNLLGGGAALAPTNVASQYAGATASASSSIGALNAPARANNDLRTTFDAYQGSIGSCWEGNAAPQWLQIDFSESKTIYEMDVFTLTDSLTANYTQPTLADTFSLYGATAYDVQYWNGASWVTIQSVSGNNKVWRQFTFTPVTTTKVRVNVTGGGTRITELEAWSMGAGSRLVVCEGDSRTGVWPTNLQTLMSGFGHTVNVTSAGETLSDMTSQVATQVAKWLTPQSYRNIYVNAGGINDSIQSTALATMKTNMQTCCENARTAGFLAVPCTIVKAGSGQVTAPNETNRQDFNTWLLANYATFADAVCDVAADPAFDDPTDTNYYNADTLHFVAAGDAAFAAAVYDTVSQM